MIWNLNISSQLLIVSSIGILNNKFFKSASLTIVNEFASQYYENKIYINFKKNDDLKMVFEENLDVDRILMDLTSKMPGIKLIPYKTLIIFDEVQECANARASIKYFVEDGRYDIIATGSLLGIKGYNKKKGKGVPTGSEHIIYMYPLDFEEFLWAKGISNEVIEYLISGAICLFSSTKFSKLYWHLLAICYNYIVL